MPTPPHAPVPVPVPVPNDDDELELPPVDDSGADGDEGAASASEELDADLLAEDEVGDAFDDATQGSEGAEELLEAGGVEAGWLLDAEDADGLDLGPADLDLGDESEAGQGDEPLGGAHHDDELDIDENGVVIDGGEEGPLAADEELREEDLPMLDEGDEGDVDDRALFEVASLGGLEELRWDDRAWVRVSAADLTAAVTGDDDVDSGAFPVPGLDPLHAARDARWRSLEESARVMAATLLPGGSVVLAVASPDGARARLVRIPSDGEPRIIAEIDPLERRERDERDEGCEVASLAWDEERSLLVATGNFERQAFRPA
jgi:hypothetical protein